MSAPSSPRTEPAPVTRGAADHGWLGQPRGLPTLALTEMWERFSFYGMRALLILFLTRSVAEGGLGLETKSAAAIYGTYTMSGYLLCILGGYLADNFIGARRAVLIGGIVIAAGHFTLAGNSLVAFYIGLALVAIGTGLLKPNVSTMVGQLYTPGDSRRDAGFSIFYIGINLGAVTAPFVTGYLAQSESWRARLAQWGLNPAHSWHWGFAAAGLGMTLGLVIYIVQGDRLGQIGRRPAAVAGGGKRWGRLAAIAAGTAGLFLLMRLADTQPLFVYILFAVQVAAILAFAFRRELVARRFAAILILFMAAEIFWAIFEQTGSSVNLFADKLTHNAVLGHAFPSAFWQSANSVWVILLAPFFAWLWTVLRDRQPSSPLKFALGLGFVAASFALMIGASHATAVGRISPGWLAGLFFLQTCGELLLSPVGLSTMTKLAPASLAGVVMGIWFLAGALGNKLAGVLASDFPGENAPQLAHFFGHQALFVAGAALAMLALVPWVKRLMGGVK